MGARLLGVAASALIIAGLAAAEPGPVERLVEGAILVGTDQATPPADDDPRWRPVTLPDEWRRRRPERSGFAWYRFALPGTAAGDARLAIYLTSLAMNAEAWVNGKPVGSGGRFEEPVARNFNRPLLFPFSGALLDGTHNVIHVRLFCYATPHHGYLGPIEVGPDALLQPRFERQLLRQHGLSQFSTWLALTMLAFVGSIWLATGRDGLYGWFALATAFWSVNSLNYWVRDVPVSGWTWERLVNFPVEGFVVALAIWAHRLLGLSRPRLERVLAGFVALSLATAVLLPDERIYPTLIHLHGVSLGIALYTVGIVVRALPRLAPWQIAIYGAGGLACLGFGLHDLSVQFGALPATTPQLLPFAVPVLLVPFGATLTARFVGSLRAFESLSRTLERRVQEKNAELERSWERTRQLERGQILTSERERMMREMHDGLGGQLVSALSLAEGGASAEALIEVLRGALDEMRVVIDSLDPEIDDLAELLGQLRARLEPVLRRNGLRSRWDLTLRPPLPRLTPEATLHVLRILQEAITNTMKHAGAREVQVHTEQRPDGGVTIRIRDDGRGLGGATGDGRGFANMRERARALGATLRTRDGQPGTLVELELPALR